MASSNEQTLHNNNGKIELIEFKVENSVFHQSPEYPSEYFAQNNKQKPSVSLDYKDVDLDTLRPFVVRNIKGGWISYDLATLFLWKFGDRFKATLTEKWESFGVTISEPGEVKLNSIIDVKFGTKEIPNSPDKDKMVSPDDDNWIASFLTSFYRINRATTKKARTKLCKVALNILFKTPGSGLNKNLNINFKNYLFRNWIRDGNYCKMIAAYDMYLRKTNIKKYQFLRWGTKNSRHRDCSVIKTWIDISKSCGYKNLSDLKQWVFTDSIGEDLERVLKDGQEIDKPDSFMPYLDDLRLLGHNSPYSYSINPSLHMFLATIGIYLGQKGLSNTLELFCDKEEVCFNGLIVAYVLRKMKCSANQSNNRGISFESDPVLEAVSTPDELLAYVKNKQPMDVINGPLDKFKKSIDARIANSRPLSIGHYLTHSLK